MLALAMSVSLFLLFPCEVADAVMPSSYTQKVADQGLDNLSDPLGLEELKRTVALWKANGAYDFDYLKKNPIAVAVIDSGVNLDHELFTGKYTGNGATDPTAKDDRGVGRYDVILRYASGKPVVRNTAYHRYNHYREDDVTDDENRLHGTHVAGIVALLIHALDLEDYIKIMPIKASVHRKVVFNKYEDTFYSDDVKSAVEFAIDNGANVINMSLSSDGESFAGLNKSDAYKKAVLVAAAGNDGGANICYPASNPNVIGVMNCTYVDGKPVLSDESNYNGQKEYYDLCAPGKEIFSADGKIADNVYNYKSLSGTSMASPIVAFGSALLSMKYRALAGENKIIATPEDIASHVRSAYTATLDRTQSGKSVGPLKVFDMNALVAPAVYDAQIEVDDVSLLSQSLGSIKPVDLRLAVVPSSEQGIGSVEWFSDGVKFASGFEARYVPEQVAGEKTVTARWKHTCIDHPEGVEQTVTLKIKVNYLQPTFTNVSKFELSAVEGGMYDRFSPGRTYALTVRELEYMPEDVAKECMWYVNAVYVHKGETYEFTPTEVGKYLINVSVGGYSSKVKEIEVAVYNSDKEGGANVLKVVSITISVTIGAVILFIAIVVVLKHKKRKSRF